MFQGLLDCQLGMCIFHHHLYLQYWFDVFHFRQECLRIMKEGAKAILVWNIRDDNDPLNQELYRVYSEHCPQFKGFGGGIVKDDQRIKDFFGVSYDYLSFS